MGLRFGKSIRLGKYVRINVSSKGIGTSVGVKGLRVSTGPRGTRMTASLPGTGLSYSRRIGSTPANRKTAMARPAAPSRSVAAPHAPSVPPPPTPGLFAPAHEKAFFKAITASRENKPDQARQLFLEAAQKDAGAGILVAIMLAQQPDTVPQAVAYLETVLKSDVEFPTPLMQKYISTATMSIDITPDVKATVPIDGLGAALLLAELYQGQGRNEEATGVLEEIEEVADEPAVTLSLCELYAAQELWDGIIDRAKGIEVADDTTLETGIYYGRAMQAKELHEAAVSVFTDALKKRKDRDPDLINEAVYWRAVSYGALGKQSQANKEFQKLYADAPGFRDVAERVK